ncbi:MAG: hypothetical protein GX126_04505, partial [Bacteroidales bacterium]|nr:hypothetical protein [Bacteroidales bacterium]
MQQSLNTQSGKAYISSIDDDGIDFKRYISLFISNWYWFAIAPFLTLSLAYGTNRWGEKMFTVSSTMLIKDDRLSGSTTELANIFPGPGSYNLQQNLHNEIGILKSFNLNLEVMNQLPDFHVVYMKVGKRGVAETQQYKNSPFVVDYEVLSDQVFNKSVNIRILSEEKFLLKINGDSNFEKELNFGDWFNEMGFDFKIERKNTEEKIFSTISSNRYFFYFVSPASLANRYRSSLSVIPIAEGASLVTLSSTGAVAEREADYLNKLMDVFIQSGLELKNQTADRTIAFIEDQLGIISDSLALAEGDMESFRLGNKLIDISQEGAVIQNKLEIIENEKTSLSLQKRYYLYLRNYIETRNESGDIVAPSVMGVSDQLITNLVNELSQLQKQKSILSMNLDESLEPVKFLDSSIITIKDAINENIKSELQNIDGILADTEERLKKVESALNKLPSTERQLIKIQRKFELNYTAYTFLLEKKAEASIAKAANVSNNRVID